jgi:hypothetical protein
MPNQRRLESLEQVAKAENSSLAYYEACFSCENFNRPPLLAKVKIWPKAVTYDGTIPPCSVLRGQLQQLLNAECSKPDFEGNAMCVPGWQVPFLNARFRVFLFSTKGHAPLQEWIEVSFASASL